MLESARGPQVAAAPRASSRNAILARGNRRHGNRHAPVIPAPTPPRPRSRSLRLPCRDRPPVAGRNDGRRRATSMAAMREAAKKTFLATLAFAALVLAGAANADGIPTTPLRGASEVPARDTKATGFVKLKLNHDGTKLEYVIHVSHIENVVMANIHLASAGHNGAAVAVLFGPAEPAGGRSGG